MKTRAQGHSGCSEREKRASIVYSGLRKSRSTPTFQAQFQITQPAGR